MTSLRHFNIGSSLSGLPARMFLEIHCVTLSTAIPAKFHSQWNKSFASSLYYHLIPYSLHIIWMIGQWISNNFLVVQFFQLNKAWNSHTFELNCVDRGTSKPFPCLPPLSSSFLFFIFYFVLFIYLFYCGIIVLQCCVSFYCTAKWSSLCYTAGSH